MSRYIDADALKYDFGEINDGKNKWWDLYVTNEAIAQQPTIDAVPTDFVMENCDFVFVCDELTDDGEWCSEHCQYSEAQPECIHRYIDRIWRKEHDETN